MCGKSISTQLLRECFITFVLDHGAILTGLTLSFPACLIPQLPADGYYVDTFLKSLLGSISLLTIGISTIIFVFALGRTKRKRIIQISFGVYAIGTVIVLLSTNTIILCIGLATQSFVSSNFIPVEMSYISEVCRKERRGTFLSTIFMCASIGLSLNYILNSLVTWRIMAIITLVVTLSGLIQTFFVPESSFWYLLHGDKEQAKASILWFEPTLTDEELNQRIETIVNATKYINEPKKGLFRELIGNFRRRSFLKPVLLGLLINLFRGGNGRLIVGVYLESIIKHIGTPYDVKNLIRWFGWAEVLGSFIILLFVHKIGRKVILFISSIILTIALSMVVAYKFSQHAGNVLPHWLPIVGLYTYAICAITTYNSVISMIISEIQVPAYRPQMTLMQSGIKYFFFYFYNVIYPYAEKVVPIEFIFISFILNILISQLVVTLFVPETSKMEFYETEKKPSDQKDVEMNNR